MPFSCFFLSIPKMKGKCISFLLRFQIKLQKAFLHYAPYAPSPFPGIALHFFLKQAMPYLVWSVHLLSSFLGLVCCVPAKKSHGIFWYPPRTACGFAKRERRFLSNPPLHGVILAIFENAKNERQKTGNLFLISCLSVPLFYVIFYNSSNANHYK